MKNTESNLNPKSIWVEICALVLLVAGGVVTRLYCEDLPNFAPVAGASLFAGWYFSRRAFAFSTPLLIMGISNLWLGGYNSVVLISVMSCLLVSSCLGIWLRSRSDSVAVNRTEKPTWKSTVLSRLAIIGCAAAGSVLFFVVTNFAVWMAWPTYTLLETYIQAIPFYRFTLYGDLFFSVVLFTTYDLVRGLSTFTNIESNKPVTVPQ